MIPSKHILVGLLCVLAAAADADAADPSGQSATLRLWQVPETTSGNPDAMAAARILDEFRGQHPGVTLKKTAGITIPQIGSSAALMMSIAGGLAPDVLEFTQADLHQFVEQRFLLPLDDELATFTEEELYARAPKALWDAARVRGPDGHTHIYAIPTAYAVSSIKLRRDLASGLGYPPQKLPRTWDELYAAAQAMTDPDQGRYGFGLPKGRPLASVFETLIVAAGGQVAQLGDDGTLHATFDSDEAATALDFLWRITRGPWERNGRRYEGVAYFDVDLWYAHKRGRYIFGFAHMGDRGILRAADPYRVLLIPMPAPSTGDSVPSLLASYAGVFAGQPDPATRRAAFDYIWLQGSDRGREIRTRTLVEEEAELEANPLDLERFGYTGALAEFPPGYVDFYRDSLSRGQVAVTGRGAAEIQRALAGPVQRILVEDLASLSDQARRARLKQVLSEAVTDVNARLRGEVSGRAKLLRQGTALAVAIAIFAGFFWQLLLVQRVYASGFGATGTTSRRRTGRILTGMKISLILLPALLLVATWEYYPLMRGTLIAFQDYRFLGGTRFVGLDNFASVLFSGFFWAAMGRTLLYVLIALLLGFASPIALAILLHEVPRGKVLFRVLYYLPALTSGVVVVFLWKSFYDPGPGGLLNYLLSFANIAPKRWLEDPALAMLCCVLPVAWAGLGPGSLIYLAALKSIPEQLFESAAIDGCGFLGKVRHVALPYMKPLIIMNLIAVFIGTFQSSGYILILTGGGPSDATMVVSLEIFYEAYARLAFGAATAMSWVLALSLIGFTLFQVRYLSRLEFRSAAVR